MIADIEPVTLAREIYEALRDQSATATGLIDCRKAESGDYTTVPLIGKTVDLIEASGRILKYLTWGG